MLFKLKFVRVKHAISDKFKSIFCDYISYKNNQQLPQNPLSSPLYNRDPFNFDMRTGQRVWVFWIF